MPEAHTQGWVDNSPSKVIETMAGGRKLRMDVPWKGGGKNQRSYKASKM